MATLLHLDSSPSPNSISRELTREFAQAWTAAHSGGEAIYRDLAANPPKPVDARWIGANFTPASQRTPEQLEALAASDEMIRELERAEEYVIGVAMHNFHIPSVLKLWIDQIARSGRTFSYSKQGSEGLLKGKKATVVVASGGVYEPGTPAAAMNHVEPYLRTILAFVGVTNVSFIAAAGAAKLATVMDRATFLKPALERVRAAAA